MLQEPEATHLVTKECVGTSSAGLSSFMSTNASLMLKALKVLNVRQTFLFHKRSKEWSFE
eukprot:6077505-Pleurochrysis_carterae.AAC.2